MIIGYLDPWGNINPALHVVLFAHASPEGVGVERPSSLENSSQPRGRSNSNRIWSLGFRV